MHFFPIYWTMGLICLVGVAHSSSVNTFQVRGNPPNISIVGGVPALAGEFPSQIIMLYQGSIRCSGTLAGPSHVITASHCLATLSASSTSSLKVRAKTLTLNGSPGFVDAAVSKFIVHQSYSGSTMDNDVAIMVLASPITNVTYVILPTDSAVTTAKPPTTKAPACACTCPPAIKNRRGDRELGETSERAFSDYANQLATISGWGTTSSSGSVSQNLLKANVTILSNTVCTSQYSSQFIPRSMLCASAAGKDTCQGDSGGPIFVNGVQVGITSWGNGCALPNYAGIYTRITTYVSWIQATIASNPAPSSG